MDVALGTSLVGLDANASRSAVSSVTCFRHASGAAEQLDLDPTQNVVLAGGGISNAQLFRQPRTDGAVPVGNESGLAGKYLMEHPHLRSEMAPFGYENFFVAGSSVFPTGGYANPTLTILALTLRLGSPIRKGSSAATTVPAVTGIPGKTRCRGALR